MLGGGDAPFGGCGVGAGEGGEAAGAFGEDGTDQEGEVGGLGGHERGQGSRVASRINGSGPLSVMWVDVIPSAASRKTLLMHCQIDGAPLNQSAR